MSIGANHASLRVERAAALSRRKARSQKAAPNKQTAHRVLLETEIHSLVFHLIILGFAYARDIGPTRIAMVLFSHDGFDDASGYVLVGGRSSRMGSG